MSTAETIRIDGSYGEGGGQILRTALALSAITGRPLELFDIRKGRKNPGLGNQHLACVRILAEIAQAEVDGGRLGSTRLRFVPHEIQAGEFVCDVAEARGSAGSVMLILQAILPVLCCAPAPSRVILRGGTHVPWSPPFQYVQWVLLPMLQRVGVDASLELIKAGWYPQGGGEVRLTVRPTQRWLPNAWNSRGPVRRVTGVSLLSNLPDAIAQRQQQAALDALRHSGVDADIACLKLPSPSQGACLVLVAACEHTLAGFAALGERGKPAEQVGREAAEGLLAFLKTDAALEDHLADQLAVFLALAPGRSQYTMSRVSRHLLTNLWTIQQCLPVRIELKGEEGQSGHVAIERTA